MARRSPPEDMRFMNIDIPDAMERIVSAVVVYYQSDYYDYDAHTIRAAMQKPAIEDRRFIWLPRRCGTWLFRERDVMTGVAERHTFNFYYENYDDGGAVPFCLELYPDNTDPEHAWGDLFALDYGKEYGWLRNYTLMADKPPWMADSVARAIQMVSQARMRKFPEGNLDDYIQGLAERKKAA